MTYHEALIKLKRAQKYTWAHDMPVDVHDGITQVIVFLEQQQGELDTAQKIVEKYWELMDYK